VFDAEGVQAFLTEVLRVGRGRIAGEEVQRDRRCDLGEDRFGAGPVRVEQRGELVLDTPVPADARR
jgi:hypothetical protein